MHYLHVESLEGGLEEALDDGVVTSRHRTAQGRRRGADCKDGDLLALLERGDDVGERRVGDHLRARRLAGLRNRTEDRGALSTHGGCPREHGGDEHGRKQRHIPHPAFFTLARHSDNHAVSPSRIMPTATNAVSTKKPPRKKYRRI